MKSSTHAVRTPAVTGGYFAPVLGYSTRAVGRVWTPPPPAETTTLALAWYYEFAGFIETGSAVGIELAGLSTSTVMLGGTIAGSEFRPLLPITLRTEEDFSQLADDEPHHLIALVRSGTLRNAQLTFAAEALGKIRDRDAAIGVLKELATHPSPLVREGVVYGLAKFRGERATLQLQRIARDDDAPFIRKLAAEALEDV